MVGRVLTTWVCRGTFFSHSIFLSFYFLLFRLFAATACRSMAVAADDDVPLNPLLKGFDILFVSVFRMVSGQLNSLGNDPAFTFSSIHWKPRNHQNLEMKLMLEDCFRAM